MPISPECTTILDYPDVSKRATELGCKYPQQMALLPINFDSAPLISDLLQASETATIKKLLLKDGVPIDNIFERDQRPPTVKNKSHDWVAPTLFVSSLLYSQNSACVSIALNILGNYATDFLRDAPGSHKIVKLNVVVEKRNKRCQKITYEGPIEGLKDVAGIVRDLNNE